MSSSQSDLLHILIVDDDTAICRSLQIQLQEHGHEVTTCTTGMGALQLVNDSEFDLVFLDLRLPDRSGLKVLQDLQNLQASPEIVMITGVQDMTAMIEAIQIGALDYVRKPLAIEDILVAVEKCTQRRWQRIPRAQREDLVRIEAESDQPYEIVGKDRRILDLLKQVGLLSRSNVTVLIAGESGTGKDLVARAIHNASSPAQPFIAINSAAIVPTLLESELFGHEKGAFTDARTQKNGLLELADGGTVFLDEIGDLPLALQPKLLRVLEDGEVRPVGSTRPRTVDVRVVAATNRDLEQEVEGGRFRQDLFWRLNVVHLHVPALRERPADIPLLAEHFLASRRISPEAMAVLTAYAWPGNVRELRNALERATTLSPSGEIGVEDLPPRVRETGRVTALVAEASRRELPLREVEKAYVLEILSRVGGNKSRAAEILEMDRKTLYRKLEEWGAAEGTAARSPGSG